MADQIQTEGHDADEHSVAGSTRHAFVERVASELTGERSYLWLLGGMWLVATAVFWALAEGHVSPRRYQDEFLYWKVAQAFAHGDGLSWRGDPIALYSPLYIVVSAFAFLPGGSIAAIYKNIHLINAAIMPLVIFPTYYLARRYVERILALFAALLSILVPAMNYVGVIGTENLAYPVAVLAFVAMVKAIAWPGRKWTLLALAGILLAALTRTQFIVLFPIYFGALIAAGVLQGRGYRREFFEERRESVRLLTAMMVVGGIVFLIAGKKIVGIYGMAFDQGLPSISDTWYWLKGFNGDVYMLAGIAPVIATIALGIGQENRRDPWVIALVSVALVGSVVLVAQNTWFSATNPYNWKQQHIFYERYMFYIGPVFFVGLVAAWGRVQLKGVIVGTAVAAASLLLFSSNNILVPFTYDAFGFTLIGVWLEDHPGTADYLGTFLALLALMFGVGMAFSTRWHERRARVATILVGVFVALGLVWNQQQTWTRVLAASKDSFYHYIAQPADFIDRSTTQPVGMIVTADDDPLGYFTTEFWNKRVVRVFTSKGLPFDSPVMYSPRCTFSWKFDGTITSKPGPGCDLVPSAFYLRSHTVTMHLKNPIREIGPQPGIRLLVGHTPAKLSSIVAGRDITNGLVRGSVPVWTFPDQPQLLRFTVATNQENVTATLEGQSKLLPQGKTATIETPVPFGAHETRLLLSDANGQPVDATVIRVDLVDSSGKATSLLG